MNVNYIYMNNCTIKSLLISIFYHSLPRGGKPLSLRSNIFKILESCESTVEEVGKCRPFCENYSMEVTAVGDGLSLSCLPPESEREGQT